MSDKTLAVYAALSKARQMAATIAVEWDVKGGGNTKGRKSADVFRMLVKVLPACKLEIIPGAVSIQPTRTEETKSGGTMFHQVISQEFHVVSTEDGSMITGGSAGSGMDNSDKYMQKALTYCNKSFVLNLLGVVDQAMDESEVYGSVMVSEAQLKELSTALSLVANKSGALKYMKSKLGTDEIDKLTESQFGSAMELIGSVPKLTDAMSAQAKDVFYKQIIDAKFVPVEILKDLNFSDDGLTYAQKIEMTDYIRILKEQTA